MKELVIFDLDGTLLDTVGDLAAACNHILAEAGYPQHPEEAYRRFVGNGIGKLIERAVPENARTPRHLEELRASFVDRYTANIDRRTRPYDGIPELLAGLRLRGVKLAVASNKFQEGTAALVERFFPEIPFVAVLGQRKGFPAKPDPAVVNEIMEAAGAAREQTLYIGDSDVDMITARNAGVGSVGVVWGFRGEKELAASGAGHIAYIPGDIIALIN